MENKNINISSAEICDRFQYFAEEYEATLKDPAPLYKPASSQFSGLIKYISRSIGFTRDIFKDIDLLDDIWEEYTSLIYKYNQRPTIEEFALLINIHRSMLYDWMNGEIYKDDYCKKLDLSRADTVRKWADECKLGRYKGAEAGNVGCIFLCKAVDKMRDNDPPQEVAALPTKTVAEIPKLADFVPGAQLPANSDG